MHKTKVWYDKHSVGLGTGFLLQLAQIYNAFRTSPTVMPMKVHSDFLWGTTSQEKVGLCPTNFFSHHR